jgi:dipeptidyl aminopeptidase/acylaminoacyl peptidase
MRQIFLSVFLIFNAATLFSQSKVLTPLDIAKISTVADVKISEDGNHIAYLISEQANPLEKNEAASYKLYTVNPKTGIVLPFYTRGSISNIAFRPGKNTITFLEKMDEDKSTSLYEFSLTGGEAVKLFEFETDITSYDWAVDGNTFAFIANETKKQDEKENILPYQPELYEENRTFKHGYIVDLKKNEVEKLNVEGYFHAIAISPDASRIAAGISPTPNVDDQYMKQKIHFINTNTLEKINIVTHEGKLGSFDFSPDGKQLAFIGGADIHDPIDGRLFVVSVQGVEPSNLQPDFKGQFESFRWLDNDNMEFIASQGVTSVFGSIKSNGKNFKTLINEGPVLEDFSRSANGYYAFLAETPQHPTEVYFMKKGDNKLERLTNSNPWLKDKALGKQEIIKYSTDDGTEIEGIVMYPLDYQKGKEYPLITVVHGGPEAHYDNGWLTYYSSPGQMATPLGYVVFYPNYRGSTGRGEAFAKSSQVDLAGAEFDDIVAGVDYLIEEGIVDENRVGVTGGSYGGYATGWLSTRYTDKFAAGVMFVGISNNISKWGTSDIPEELFLVHARKRVWDDYDFFLERSPIFYAGQAKTPLLIMAGAEDTRVHPSQSIELYRHIKVRTDTPVRLVLYPGEGHGNRNATARLDYTLRQLRWFGKYLKGEDYDLEAPVDPQEFE